MGGGYFIIIVFSFLGRIIPKCIFVQEYVIYAVQYSIVAIMGLRFAKNKKSGIVLGIISFLILLNGIITTGAFEPSAFKYPPHIYYISYGLLCSAILYCVMNYLQKYLTINKKKMIAWLSIHSFSIYIYHIYYLWLFFALGKLGISLNYIFEFLILIIASIGQTIIYENLKERMEREKR